MTSRLELPEHYRTMSTDELVRLSADRGRLTAEAAEALGRELNERHLADPNAIREYELERDRQIKAEDLASARRWSNRLGINKILRPLRQRPLAASLISICCSVVAYEIFNALRIGGSHLFTFLVFLLAAFGAKCGVIAVRSSAPLLIRFLGLLGALVGVPLAFIFLVYAIFGVG
jgi:hypothetical protein